MKPFWNSIVWCAFYLCPVCVVIMQIMSRILVLIDKFVVWFAAKVTKAQEPDLRERIKTQLQQLPR